MKEKGIEELFRNNMDFWGLDRVYLFPFSGGSEKALGVVSVFTGGYEIPDVKLETIRDRIGLLVPRLTQTLKQERLFEKASSITRKTRIMEKTFEIAQKIDQLAFPEKIYETLIRELLELFGYELGTLYMKKDNLLEPAYILPVREEFNETAEKLRAFFKKYKGFQLDPPDGIVSLTFQRNGYIQNPDMQSMLGKFRMSEKSRVIMEILQLKSNLQMPIRRNGEAIGLLALNSMTRKISLSELEIKTVELLCSFIGTAIHNAGLFALTENQRRELQEKDQIIREDLFMAKRIQGNLIPDEKEINQIHEKLDFFIRYRPQSEIGGDFYNVVPLNENAVRIFMADATGHGIQAALTTMLIQTEYQKVKKMEKRPHEILRLLNDSFIGKYYHLTVFFSCIILDIDLQSKTFYYASAGHPDQIYLNRDGGHVLSCGGKLIGLFEGTNFSLQKKRFDPQSKLMLYTDGLFEQFNEKDEEFGEKRLLERVSAADWGSSIQEAGSSLWSSVEEFMGEAHRHDDMTLMGIQLRS
jgi:serine phosphatase RsbU (regulator of sigma subunit)